jgi:hypothetical protein
MGEKVKFPCTSCGREFTWKPEIAGKRAKCKCGSVLTVPKTMPQAQPPPEEIAEDDFGIAGMDDEPIAPPPMAAPPPIAAPGKLKKPAVAALVGSAAANLATGGRDDGDTWKWWYYVVGGFAMVPVAFYQYFRLLDYEHGKDKLELKSFEMMLYGIFGKWGVCGFLILIGAVCITIGLYKWKGHKAAEAAG